MTTTSKNRVQSISNDDSTVPSPYTNFHEQQTFSVEAFEPMEIGVITESGFETSTLEFEEDESNSDFEQWDEGGLEFGEESRTSREFKIASVSGVPEFKTRTRRHCRRVFGRRVCASIPSGILRRSSSYTAYVKISTGRITNRDVWNAIRRCVVAAAGTAGIASTLAGVASGGSASIAAAKPAFTAALVGCLQRRGGEFARIASDVRVSMRMKKTTGEWR